MRSELKDEVMSLKQSTIRSVAPSRISSQYLSQLESQIDEERKERLKLQKELDEIKKINEQLMQKVKTSHN